VAHGTDTPIPGFVFFVASLQNGNYKFQFTNFAWTHMALYLIVFQAHFIMNNIFEGMIWFFLPAALVINNDIWAYICGITFGRTQLIKLSPKKTVEGFVGAWVMTMVFAVILVNLMMRSKYFICPVNVSSVTERMAKPHLHQVGPRRQYSHWPRMRG
jgi:phosphatidate cytidylyltransferase